MRSRFPIVRLTSVALFALLCATVAWWALQLLTHQSPVAPAGAVARSQAPIDLAQAGRLFGGAAATVAGPSGPTDIRVTGVVAAGERSVALLAVGGRPAKAFSIGQSVTEGVRLEAVEPTVVRLSQGGAIRELEAPARGSVAVLTRGPARGAPDAPLPPGATPPAAPSAAAAPLPRFGADAAPATGTPDPSQGESAGAGPAGAQTVQAPGGPAAQLFRRPGQAPASPGPAGTITGTEPAPALQRLPATPTEPASSTQ